MQHKPWSLGDVPTADLSHVCSSPGAGGGIFVQSSANFPINKSVGKPREFFQLGSAASAPAMKRNSAA